MSRKVYVIDVEEWFNNLTFNVIKLSFTYSRLEYLNQKLGASITLRSFLIIESLKLLLTEFSQILYVEMKVNVKSLNEYKGLKGINT